MHIENTDFWGNTSLLSNIETGGVFAETYALWQYIPGIKKCRAICPAFPYEKILPSPPHFLYQSENHTGAVTDLPFQRALQNAE